MVDYKDVIEKLNEWWLAIVIVRENWRVCCSDVDEAPKKVPVQELFFGRGSSHSCQVMEDLGVAPHVDFNSAEPLGTLFWLRWDYSFW